MTELVSSMADKIDRTVQRVIPLAYRVRRTGRRLVRRALRKPRSVSEGPNLLPLLIQVLASFTKADGIIMEEEIDSSLGFLRYDYPEAVYSELRQLFRQALYEQQDLAAMAQKLGIQLSTERKIMLGVQLYDLISQAGLKQEQVVAFYSFMSQMGMAAQAIDIVYQLNASEESDPSIYQHGASPLESLSFGADSKADIVLKNLGQTDRLMAFRYHDLILLKNYSGQNVSVRGRPLVRGGFCRIYPGQRILIGDQVLSDQERAQDSKARKNVSLPQIFIRVSKDAEQVQLERSRTRESALRVTFGLKVRVKALRDIDAELKGTRLKGGTHIDATLEDKIVFHNDTELDLNDLRRRARALGGRFQLKASKSEYLVSNDPSRLQADDILLSPGTAGDVLLKIFCDYDRRIGSLEVIEADRRIMVGDDPVRTTAELKDGDIIRIDVGQVLRCNFLERIIEEERNIIRSLELNEVTHRFGKGEIGLDGISFSITRGELVCVMGASGAGKSTLMRVLAGQLQPTNGEVLLNGQSLYRNLDVLKQYVSYMPQQDAFDEHLTIGENLQFAAAIRAPHLSKRDRVRRLDAKLIELGLSERRDAVVGSPEKKTLSGGERKRLNIGLDMIGDVIYEENSRGQLVPSRRYSPDFWRDKYEAFRLIQDVKQVSLQQEEADPLPVAPVQRKRLPVRWHDEWTQFRTVLRRAFTSKLRNRANLVITIGVSPVLALLIGTILRYSENGTYDFASAYHIPTFLFLGLIVAMFLGLTNSADDIIRDRPVLQRERNIKVRLSYYVISKTITLGFFALIQCVLFVLIGNFVLQIRGMFWLDLAIMFLTAMSGVALGLVISSLVADPKTAANIVPLVLIPQIIMGGALIKYEDMNRNLGLLYSFSHWFSEHPNSEKTKKTESKLQVPLICQFIAMRWSYEEMIVAQAKLNPLMKRQDRAHDEIQKLAPKADTPQQRAHLNDLKDVLALLSGLEGPSPRDVDRYLKLVDPAIAGKQRFDRSLFKDAKGPVTADQLYVNQKVSDLISRAEMEQNDYRRGNKPNVFFGLEKRYFGIAFGVFTFDTAVLVVSMVGLLVMLHWILRKQLEVRRS